MHNRPIPVRSAQLIRKASLFVLFVVLTWQGIYAQSGNCRAYTDAETAEEVYTVADTPPRYGNDENDLFEFLYERIQVHRDQLTKHYETIHVTLIIDETGNLTYVGILRGGNDEVNEHVLAAFQQLEQWTPAMCDGKPVAFKLVVPMTIHFRK